MKESAERVGMACLVPNEPANRHMLTIRVHDEFGKLRAAIVHDGSKAGLGVAQSQSWRLALCHVRPRAVA